MSLGLFCVISAASVHLDYLTGALYKGEELTICLRFENRTAEKSRVSCEVELRSGEKWTIASSRRRGIEAGGSWVFSGSFAPEKWERLEARSVGAKGEKRRLEVVFLREGKGLPRLTPGWWNLHDERGRIVVPVVKKRLTKRDRTWYWPRKLARELERAPAGSVVVVGERNALPGGVSYLDILSRSKSPRVRTREYSLPAEPCYPVLAAAAAVSRLEEVKSSAVAVVVLPWEDAEMGTPLRLYSRSLDFILVSIAAKGFGRAVLFPPLQGPRVRSYAALAGRSCEAYQATLATFDLPAQFWLAEGGEGRLSRPGPGGQERMARQIVDAVE